MKGLMRKTLHMTGTRSGALDMARGRLVIISGLFVIAYIIVAARAFDLSILQAKEGGAESISSYIETPDTGARPHRGDIVDRNGVILARSLHTASLYADPALIPNPQDVAKDLHGIFPDMAYGDLLQKLQDKKRFVWIRRNMTPEDHHRVFNLGHPGLGFKEEDRRIYPQDNLAAHVVGYTNIDGKGLAGIESGFDSLLQGHEEPLQLSLDVRLQHALRREVRAAMKKHSGIGAAGIIMDVRNGEVLAATSLPDFDANDAGHAKQQNKFNRVSLGVYEPGSTFKIFSTAALLELTDAGMGKAFDAREPLHVGRFKISDYHAEKRILTLPEVFMHSSNIGSALMGKEVGTEKFKAFLDDLGLLTTPDIEIAERTPPLVPSPWGEVSTLTASFGHGIAVSPLQLVSAAASIVNGGILVRPTFVLSQGGHGDDKNASDVRVVSPQTAHRMRQLMRLVVTDGTGGKADVPGFNVGGKTGTAEKAAAGGYDKKRLISSFLAVFPADAPRYAVYIMVDEPKGTKDTYGYATGGWVAAPAVKNTIQAMASILGLQPDVEAKDIAAPLRAYVKTKEQIEKESKQEGGHLASFGAHAD